MQTTWCVFSATALLLLRWPWHVTPLPGRRACCADSLCVRRPFLSRCYAAAPKTAGHGADALPSPIRAQEMLRSHRDALETATQQLLETETVTGEELDAIVAAHPPAPESAAEREAVRA